ncbi:MAG: DUF1844 domain-containing protein [Deltaproteobacteria bacterium]|nr:MAG: DUF1844 domain-containing protein [Deltaproteobacteria bacterium]
MSEDAKTTPEQRAQASRDFDAAAEKVDAETTHKTPPVDFSTFVLSMASSALIHLGETEHPESGERTVNLPLARQTIDMLAMLEKKTAGNLERDEERLLQAVLYDLRLRFVAAAERRGVEHGQS